MVMSSKSKIYKSGNSNLLYVSGSLLNDSQFPFKINEELKITIQGKKLIVEKV